MPLDSSCGSVCAWLCRVHVGRGAHVEARPAELPRPRGSRTRASPAQCPARPVLSWREAPPPPPLPSFLSGSKRGAAEPRLVFGKSADLSPLRAHCSAARRWIPWAHSGLCFVCCPCTQVGAREPGSGVGAEGGAGGSLGEATATRWVSTLETVSFAFPFCPGFTVPSSFLHFCVLSPSHRLGCSCTLLPSERGNLRGQFHPQPRLGPWECPRLLLPPGPVPSPHIQAVPEQRTVADPEIQPGSKGGLQT